MAAWRAGGWDALEPQSRRPTVEPERDPTGRRRTGPGPARGAGRRRLRRRPPLDRRAPGTTRWTTPPAVTTIWRILTRAGVITPEPRKRPKRSWMRFEADLPNECWQADFTHCPLADGTDAEILLWVDDHSRFLISATAHPPVTGRIVVDTFRTACTIHGTPQSTLTDNGFVFTTRHRGGPNAFEIELLNLGIAQKNGTPNHPQTQGKVERLNQTLKHWLRARPRRRDPGRPADPARRVHRLLQPPPPPPLPEPPHPRRDLHRPRQGHPRPQPRRPLPHPRRHGPRQRHGHPAPRRTPAPHQPRHRARRHPRPHAHPRPRRHRHRPRHRRDPPRTDHRPRQGQPAPRPANPDPRTAHHDKAACRRATTFTPEIRKSRDIR